MKTRVIDTIWGERCSKIAYNWAKRTFIFRRNKNGMPATDMDGTFANSVFYDGKQIGITSDGIGTKIEVAERLQKYDSLGYDLVSMVADDLVANGFEPANLSNILDVDDLDYKIVDDLMKGLYFAARFANISVTGGEIAELGGRICGYGDDMHFNWTATAIGSLIEGLEHPITGKDIKAGDCVVALASEGFRSNGFSLARKILSENFGDDWHNAKYDQLYSWGEQLLPSSLTYSPLIVKILKITIHKINGIAHITGGGIPENLKRVLAINNLGANLDNLFEPHEPMKKLAELGSIDYKDLYRIWNMGNGMLLIVPKEEAENLVRYIGYYEDYKYKAKIAGVITEDNKIVIKTDKGDLIY